MYKNGKNIVFTDRSINSVNSFLRDISKSKPLTKAEEYALWRRMQQGSLQARNQLICANLRYVVTVAKKYFPAKAVFDDLIMAGCEGIIKAADKCMYGAGELAGDLYKMLQNGYTTSDFARKHHLSKKEMSRLFDILQKEAEYIARQSA